MNHGSLFSGIGGFDLASKWMGWNNVFNCEIEEFPRTILKHHFPNTISYEDIKQTDFSIHRGGIDVLTGGFLCQPFSQAGLRKGKEDERYLWDEMLRAITEIQPNYIVAENVFGLLNQGGGLVFEQVCSDLETQGYEVQPIILPAAGVNAPHKRDRIWFVAHTNGFEIRRKSFNNGQGGCLEESKSQKRGEIRDTTRSNVSIRNAADPNNERTYTDIKGHKQRYAKGQDAKRFWDNFPSEHGVCEGNDGLSKGVDDKTFSKHRTKSIKALGNAIVPQVAFKIFQSIVKTNNYE